MRHVKRRLVLTMIFFLLAKFSALHAQACVEDYFYADINTLTVQQPNSTLVTSENEIAVAGDVFRYNSVLKEGWVTKYSARGTILWTRRYYTSAYNYVSFNNIVEAEDGNFLVTGNIGDVDTSSWPVTHITEYGLLMKIDKYGSIIWSKSIKDIYTFYFPFLSDVQSTIIAKDGDYILTLSHFNKTEYTDYRMVSRIDKDGNIKWMSTLNSPNQRAATGSTNVAQLKNNDIFFITNVSQFSDKYFYLESGLYMASLDYNTGEKKWERFYVSEDSLTPTPKAYGNITGITEFDNGDISFITSYSGNALKSFHPTTEVLNFVLDSLGNFPRIKSYGNGTKPFYASSSVLTNPDGSRIVLMDNADVPYLMEIRRDGTIKWQKSYGAVGRAQETRSALHTAYGNYIFMFTHDGGSKTLKLIKTDSLGSVPCIENTASIQMKDPEFRHYIHTLKMVYTPLGATWNTFTWLNSKDYTMSEDFKCRKVCCTDVTDTTAKISLCDKPYYILPNADTVKSSGTYSVVYKASTGCDSIVYYPVDFGFTPSVTAGRDRCMGEKDTIMLSATSGYDTYYWNNMISYNNTYVVQQPGTYIVNVSERCGSSMDTVQVYKECEFEIKMPNAFTPNGDNKNDIFRVPPQIYNRLLRFTIYNRWGQMMFTTSDMAKGWDGRFNSNPAPTGTYVYYVVMRSLDNRRDITSKGYVTLLR